jgi:predicted MFS family arabinose efflux permease
MSVAAALGTAAIYPLQPAISSVSESLTTSVATVGLALAGGPLGYLAGLALLVPLVDRHPPHRVLSVQFGALSFALGLAAVSGEVWTLGLVMVVIGVCSSVGAGLSSVVGRLARPARRATDLGIVTAGISSGILGGRIIGGWLADLIGWREMLTGFAVASAAAAVASLVLLPKAPAAVSRGYLATLASIPALFYRSTALRLASLRGALWFFAFCAVWSGIAVALSGPPYSYSAERIGLYALAGIAGVAATRVAGAWTDRIGPHAVVLVGLAMAASSCAVLALALGSTVVTLGCLALFDAGLFAAQVANQSAVLAIDAAGPARFNSAYMIVYFVGGSLGTAFGAGAAEHLGWTATATVACSVIAVATLVTLAAPGRTRPGAASADLVGG